MPLGTPPSSYSSSYRQFNYPDNSVNNLSVMEGIPLFNTFPRTSLSTTKSTYMRVLSCLLFIVIVIFMIAQVSLKAAKLKIAYDVIQSV
jgi:hypothetical protein